MSQPERFSRPTSEPMPGRRPGGAPSGAETALAPVALVKESGLGLGQEIQTLLRRRLWLMAIITAIAWTVHGAGTVAPRFLGAAPPVLDDWLFLAFVALVPACDVLVMT